MTILITGSAGYIGTQLIERLSPQTDIETLDLVNGQDLRTTMLGGTYEYIIHLAGKSGVRDSLNDPAGYWQNNVEAFQRLLAVFGKSTRILYASSSSAAEPDLNPYAASKFCMERAAARFPKTIGMRFHTVYNDKPRQGMFIQKVLDNELKWINNHSRDFIHMEDLLDAIELVIKSNLSGTLDIGTGTAVPIPTLAPPGMPVHLSSVGERQQTKANIDVLQKLGFQPKYNVIQFLKDHKKIK